MFIKIGLESVGGAAGLEALTVLALARHAKCQNIYTSQVFQSKFYLKVRKLHKYEFCNKTAQTVKFKYKVDFKGILPKEQLYF